MTALRDNRSGRLRTWAVFVKAAGALVIIPVASYSGLTWDSPGVPDLPIPHPVVLVLCVLAGLLAGYIVLENGGCAPTSVNRRWRVRGATAGPESARSPQDT